MQPLKRPSHGVIAGYAGLALGAFALAGGPAFARSVLNGHDLKTGSVTSAKLATNSVTAAKIRAGSITRVKLAAGAVDSGSVRDLSLGVADLSVAARAALHPALGPGSVTASTIASGAVTGAKLAQGAVSTLAIGDGAVTADQLAVGAAGGAAIPAHVVVSIPVGHVNASSVASASVTCPPDEQALGGGVSFDAAIFGTAPGAILPVVTISAPTLDPVHPAAKTPNGWTATLANANTIIGGADFTVYAICA